ncbi:HD domain-containing protein [Kovacikia minuta CCNUW1]|uniref:HD domain-containing protein n=1 Tax=Kovacikia minuta TaxID=2931930 RepID=UPI001CCE6259|nr:HD domain-containing protein [Kovacikia minuta]UBF28012.1 HD domain-containing protein [Kovacikia minuta CCNUW1]
MLTMNLPNRIQLTERFETALVYANHLHRSQYRKDGRVPYIAHLLSVAALVLENGGDEDQAIAALLHDAIEDQGGNAMREVMHQQFGDRVTAIVDGCTETDVTPKPDWKARKLAYLQRLQQADAEVRRVSLADKLHNARSLLASLDQEGEIVWSRFSGGKAGVLWYYRCLNEIYQATGDDYLSQEFQRVLTQIDAFGNSPE